MSLTSEHPTGWAIGRLGDLATDFLSGGTPSTKEGRFWKGTIPWTTSAAITEDDVVFRQAERRISQEAVASSATTIVPRNSLLVSTRVGVGKAAVNPFDLAISQDLTGVILDERIDPLFIAYQFKTGRIQSHLKGRRRGTTIQGISRFDLESVELWLPPLHEQQRIRSTLEAVGTSIQVRRRELALERERKAALMHHLFTHGTRGEPRKQTEIGEMPQSWQACRLGDVARIAYGLTVNEARRTSDTRAPYLTVANVTRGALRLDQVNQIGMLANDAESYRLHKGDILLVEGSGNPQLLGSAAVWNDQLPFVLHQNHLIRARLDQSRAHPAWVMTYLNSDNGRAQLLGKAKTSSGLHNINSRVVADLRAPLPTMEEQHEIVDVFDASDALIAGLERERSVLNDVFRAMLEDLMTGRMLASPLLPSRLQPASSS